MNQFFRGSSLEPVRLAVCSPPLSGKSSVAEYFRVWFYGRLHVVDIDNLVVRKARAHLTKEVETARKTGDWDVVNAIWQSAIAHYLDDHPREHIILLCHNPDQIPLSCEFCVVEWHHKSKFDDELLDPLDVDSNEEKSRKKEKLVQLINAHASDHVKKSPDSFVTRLELRHLSMRNYMSRGGELRSLPLIRYVLDAANYVFGGNMFPSILNYEKCPSFGDLDPFRHTTYHCAAASSSRKDSHLFRHEKKRTTCYPDLGTPSDVSFPDIFTPGKDNDDGKSFCKHLTSRIAVDELSQVGYVDDAGVVWFRQSYGWSRLDYNECPHQNFVIKCAVISQSNDTASFDLYFQPDVTSDGLVDCRLTLRSLFTLRFYRYYVVTRHEGDSMKVIENIDEDLRIDDGVSFSFTPRGTERATLEYPSVVLIGMSKNPYFQDVCATEVKFVRDTYDEKLYYVRQPVEEEFKNEAIDSRCIFFHSDLLPEYSGTWASARAIETKIMKRRLWEDTIPLMLNQWCWASQARALKLLNVDVVPLD